MRWLRRCGPAAERRALELAATLPAVFGIAAVTVLVAQSLIGADHCLLHHHHAHLCLLHGSPWLGRSWAVTLVTGAAVLGCARYTMLAVTMVRRRRSIARLRAASSRVDGIWWIDSPHAVCFVAGPRRPEIYVSTGTWDALDDDERAAMLAHERAHVRHGDIGRRILIDVCSSLAAPLAARLRCLWDSATERLCDARAAADVGSSESVASAMVKVSRLGVQARISPAGFTPQASALADRVDAVLSDPPTGDRAARVLLTSVACAALGVIVMAAFHAQALHNAIEQLFG